MKNFLHKHRSDLWFFLIVIVIVLFDQITKVIIINTFSQHQSKVIIPKLLSFTYIPNTGIGFSLLQGMNTFLIVVVVAIIFLIMYYKHKIKEENKIPQEFFAFIVAGALSNLVDRIAYGFVVDFIDMHIWPAFNLADIAITIGIIGLIFYSLRKEL